MSAETSPRPVREILAGFPIERLARLAGQSPEDFANAVEAENREHQRRQDDQLARADAIRLARIATLETAPAPRAVVWTCPRCGTETATTDSNPRCDRCGFRED